MAENHARNNEGYCRENQVNAASGPRSLPVTGQTILQRASRWGPGR